MAENHLPRGHQNGDIQNDAYIDGQFSDASEDGSEEQEIVDVDAGPEETPESLCEGDLFVPPLYRQRYAFVASELSSCNIKSLIDFGCAECSSMVQLRRVDSLQRIDGVDLDEEALMRGRHLITPLASDFLIRRPNPLTIRLFKGSLLDIDRRVPPPEAISLIEVIEHLNPEVLDPMPEVVFGHYKPYLVIITTPNCEYNVVFPNFSGMRHWDHKFEWNRAQFKEWCETQVQRYPYSVRYEGVGLPPASLPDVGHCTQIAIFTRKHSTSESSDSSLSDLDSDSDSASHKPAPRLTTGTPFTLVSECEHPYAPPRPLSERLHDSVQQTIRLLVAPSYNMDPPSDEDIEDDPDHIRIPVSRIHGFHRVRQHCSTLTEFIDFLEESDFVLTPDCRYVLWRRDPTGDDDSSSTESVEHNVISNGVSVGDVESGPEEYWG